LRVYRVRIPARLGFPPDRVSASAPRGCPRGVLRSNCPCGVKTVRVRHGSCR
jgi:hypothetical protein